MIQSVHARSILDSRGNPTVEVDVTLADGSFGRAAVPSGASTGSREALELRDGGSAYAGKAVQQAVDHVNQELSNFLQGKAWSQHDLDTAMCSLDGTPNKAHLGANAILGVSLAHAVAQASAAKMPLFRWIHGEFGQGELSLPRPMLNIMNGGAHADWTTDIQEYMILPLGEESYPEKLRKAVEVFHALGKLLKSKGYSIQVGNEGGYAPALKSNQEAFELILQAIEAAGYTVGEGKDFVLGIDAAASEFFQDGKYHLRRDGRTLSPEEMVEWVENLTKQYPLYSLEDPFAESDWSSWAELTRRIGKNHQIVGDDLLVTQSQYVERAIAEQSCNSVLVKLNQVGTLTETLDTMRLAAKQGWSSVPSHRSGETEDTFIAHLAVGTGAGQIKTGAPSRTDRTAKYNELLRIAEAL